MASDGLYILGGPELGRRNEFVSQLKLRCAGEWAEPPEEHRLYAGDTDVNALMALLLNGSLFSNGRFVQYMNAELAKSKSDAEILAAYARKPAERTVLALVTEGYGLDKAIEEAAGKDRKKVFWELSEAEIRSWTSNYFREAGLLADDDALDALLELVENNTEAVKTECSRICLFYPRGSRVTEEDVEKYIAHGREEDAFSLFERMALDDFGTALETLSAILASREGSGIGLLAGLLWSFRRLSSLHDAMADGTPYEQAARSLRITSRKLLALHDAARRRYPPGLTRRIAGFGVETDARLRASGQGFERIYLELFLYAAMVAKRPVRLSVPSGRPG